MKLFEYHDLAAQLEAMQQKLEDISSSPELKKELEFESKLFALLEKYDVNALDAIRILDPEYRRTRQQPAPAAAPASDRGTRGKPGDQWKRKFTTYRNPHTGETATVSTLNQAPVFAWRKEHGAETVRGWAIQDEAA